MSVTKREDGGCERQRRHHGNRFGRSEEARDAVMRAVDDLLLESGFAALTIEGVAARAGVGRQTIYRWWQSKVDLLFDAYRDETEEEIETDDLGALRPDLLFHVRQVLTFFSQASNAAMFRALAGQAQHDATVASRFRDVVMDEQRARARTPFERAMLRGELPADFDAERAAESLFMPVLYRLLVYGLPPSPDDAEDLVACCLATAIPPGRREVAERLSKR